MRQDLIGKKFGRLTVISEAEPKKDSRGYYVPMYHCKCDCGNELDVRYTDLLSGNTQSCGCLQSERASQARYKHGETGTKLYWAYSHMMQRCYNPKNESYKNYGARGIEVCDEWREKPDGINNFFNWAKANGFDENNKGLTLERINTNGNYEPSNCEWADNVAQANNKRTNINLNVAGHRLTVKQFSREFHCNYQTTLDRVKRGWTVEELIAIDPSVKLQSNYGLGERARQKYIEDNNIHIPKEVKSPVYNIKTGEHLGRLDKYPKYEEE